MSGPNLEIARDLIARFFNGRNPALATEFFASDLEWHGGSVGSVAGAENYADAMRQFFAAVPAVRAAEQDVLVDGDKVALRLVVEGTYEGDPWGVPPSGNRVAWDFIITYRFADGKVAERWAAEDWVSILQGIGVFTPPWLPRD